MQRQQIFGILNVNKPEGLTSHDVVARLRKILNTRQIGHTGTLDPMATGVLPICAGKSTKLIEYFNTDKAYRAYILLGVKTDSYDLEGKVTGKKPVSLNIDDIKTKLDEFKGNIRQIPPMYSAVHYKGKRLYEYARKNVEIEDIPAREVFISSINLVDIQNQGSENPVLVVDIECSGGTYIRTIAHDLGEKLGYGACLSGLTRTKSGGFKIEESVKLEEIQDYAEKNELDKILTDPSGVLELDKIEINEEILSRISKGQYFFLEKFQEEEKTVQLVFRGKLIAIAKLTGKQVKPKKVLI